MQCVGWLLLLVGIAALFLPGPGLLMMFAGLALLSQSYKWAGRWLDPVRLRALRGAAEGVETWPRILMSTTLALWLAACGVLWIVQPGAPGWWPVDEKWWLIGGMGAGVSLLISAAVAIGLIGYSYRRFHGKPEAVLALESSIEDADTEMQRRH